MVRRRAQGGGVGNVDVVWGPGETFNEERRDETVRRDEEVLVRVVVGIAKKGWCR